MSDLSLPDLQERLLQAITAVYRFEAELLNTDASERSLTHKLAEHLQKQFPYWHVDCEYNRRRLDPKRQGQDLVLPDVVIHRRNTPDNLLVIEVKKANGGSDSEDLKKLEQFVRDPEYKYPYALFLSLGVMGCKRATLLIGDGSERDLTDTVQGALQELGYGE